MTEIDLKPEENLEITVRNQDSHKPLKDMTVRLQLPDKKGDNNSISKSTDAFGKVNFEKLCAGDFAYLTVSGTTFERQGCQAPSHELIIGTVNKIRIPTNC